MNAVLRHLLTGTARLICYDSLGRADSASSMGAADTGHLWQALSGTWGITGNTAYRVTHGSNTYDVVVIDSGVSDCQIQVPLTTYKNGSRVAFRATDANNLFFVYPDAATLYVYRRQAGTPTSIGSISYTPANGDVVSISLLGPAIQVYVNGGAPKLTLADTFNQTATNHGLLTTSGDGARWGAFSIESVQPMN